MRTVALAICFILAGCSTTTSQLGERPKRYSTESKLEPQQIADCIARETPGLYVPVTSGVGQDRSVVWRQEPLGAVALFDIKATSSGSTVAIRSVTKALNGRLKKLDHCYQKHP